MKRVSLASLVTAALVSGYLQLTAAETARLRYLASVYVDQQGAGLRLPEGVACGRNGEFVVGDTGNDRLLRFTYGDRTVGDGTEIKVPELSAPSRVQLTSKGEIYALDSRQRRIVHFSREGEFRGFVTFDRVPPPATIVPKGFTIDSLDNIYVLDTFSGRVLALNARQQFQRALALPDDVGFGSELAVDFAGNLLLLDSIKRRMFSAARDAGSFALPGADLSRSIATVPTYVTATRGIVFVVEGSGSSILAYGRDGTFLTRQLTMGWNEGSLNYPSQICINDRDEVFIADRDNSRIQVFQLTR